MLQPMKEMKVWKICYWIFWVWLKWPLKRNSHSELLCPVPNTCSTSSSGVIYTSNITYSASFGVKGGDRQYPEPSPEKEISENPAWVCPSCLSEVPSEGVYTRSTLASNSTASNAIYVFSRLHWKANSHAYWGRYLFLSAVCWGGIEQEGRRSNIQARKNRNASGFVVRLRLRLEPLRFGAWTLLGMTLTGMLVKMFPSKKCSLLAFIAGELLRMGIQLDRVNLKVYKELLTTSNITESLAMERALR